MTPAAFSLEDTSAQHTGPTALVVEPSLAEALSLHSTLSELGFQVSISDSFSDAKARLRPSIALLVTELRLHEYNGLHLVFRAKSVRREMAAIIRTAISDPLLQLEAERMGATFVLKTASAADFRAAVCRTLFRSADSVDPIRPPFERRQRDRRAAQSPSDVHSERRVRERRVDPVTSIRESTL
jgi:DNA-binding NtrC family response regulator